MTYKNTEHVDVAAGDTITISITCRVATTQTVVWADSLYYTAILFKR